MYENVLMGEFVLTLLPPTGLFWTRAKKVSDVPKVENLFEMALEG